MVFIRVWPVLKSFPQMGTRPVCFASCSSGGTSADRFGRPVRIGDAFHDGGVGVDHARRDRRGRCRASIAASKASMVLCDRPRPEEDLRGSAPDHDGARSHPLSALNRRMSAHAGPPPIPSLFCAGLHVRARPGFLTYSVSEHGPASGFTDSRKSLIGSKVVLLVQHAGVERARVSVVGNRIPGTDTRSSSSASGTKSLIRGVLLSVRFPQADGVHLRQGADRLGQPLTGSLHAGHERRRHRPETGQHDGELALGRLDLFRLLSRCPLLVQCIR